MGWRTVNTDRSNVVIFGHRGGLTISTRDGAERCRVVEDDAAVEDMVNDLI